jgi:hypothetical protein
MYERGIAAARGGQRRVAAGLLTKAVQLDPRHEHAWLWLSGVLDDPKDVAFCLNSALKLNPDNHQAQKGLAWLAQKHAAVAQAPAPTPTTSRLQSIEIPPAPGPQPAAEPATWWHEWRSSERNNRLFRLGALGGLMVLILATSIMLWTAPNPAAARRNAPAQVEPPPPNAAGVVQQTVLTAPEVNQAAILHYLSKVDKLRETIRVAAESYRSISDVSTVATQQIEAARVYRDVLRQTYTDLERIAPPSVLSATHAEYMQGIQLEQAAFDDILDYYTNYNVAIANRAALRLQEAGGHYERARAGWGTYQQTLSTSSRGTFFGVR